MKRLACVLALVAAALAAGPGEARKPREVHDATNPSALIAAEIAFNRMAQEEGQWTAFRKFADEEAVMFVPQPVNAAEWLKGRADPSASVVWQPHQVWISCDGTLGATKGAWQRPDGSTGYFTTVWKRQKKGEYLWVMDQGDALAEPLEAPDMLSAKVAACRSKPAPPSIPVVADGEMRAGQSTDGTLAWNVWVRPDGTRHVSIGWWDGAQWQSAVAAQVSP